MRLIIKRWCPPGTEEKNNTTGYTRFVMERMRKAFPDMTQDTVMRWWEQDRIYRLVSAMAIMESGYKVTPELFGEAWQMLNK